MKRVLEWGMQRRSFVQVEDGATKGAKVGTNVYNADGSVWDPTAVVTEIVEAQSAAANPNSVFRTLWKLILEIPANIVSLAALSGIGFATRISAGGDWANRVIVGTFGRIDVADGDGVTGDPVINLGDWPTVQNSIEVGLEYTIPLGHQLIVYDEFDNAGDLTVDGDLIIL